MKLEPEHGNLVVTTTPTKMYVKGVVKLKTPSNNQMMMSQALERRHEQLEGLLQRVTSQGSIGLLQH